ncbi:hypothetical protein [Polaromonas sp. YR568]|uniref:hypothetical protein n=1 Tax=Polaromonas sp. YR568 TaxID=1855301 RepID=UPI00398C196A
MQLSTFINASIEEILGEWNRFAKTLFPPEDKSNAYLLRDHAREPYSMSLMPNAAGSAAQARSIGRCSVM